MAIWLVLLLSLLPQYRSLYWYVGRNFSSIHYVIFRFGFYIINQEVKEWLNRRKFYKLEICGLTGYLRVLPINEKVSIAGFIILGDTELVCRVAPELVKKGCHL